MKGQLYRGFGYAEDTERSAHAQSPKMQLPAWSHHLPDRAWTQALTHKRRHGGIPDHSPLAAPCFRTHAGEENVVIRLL